jgi:hypothetical protein
MSYLRYLCLFTYSDVQHTLCCVFVLFVFVLCTLCCQFLWIVFVLFFFVLCTLCCQFHWIVLCFCFVCLRLMYPMLPVSLVCPFSSIPSLSSNVYFKDGDVILFYFNTHSFLRMFFGGISNSFVLFKFYLLFVSIQESEQSYIYMC